MASSQSLLKNQLANSPSPYLRAHKDNPVAWQEWSPETLAYAREHQRMIFLSIGYNACHWCHVMEKESFSSTEVADILNASFVPIKLDRESRPDLDEIYMNFVTATTGHGGWPLNVFLTPDLKPVFGGTYWPGPNAAHTTPEGVDSDEQAVTLVDILQKMVETWSTDRQKCITSAESITQQLREFAAEGNHGRSNGSSTDVNGTADAPEQLDLDLLDEALTHFTTKYDREYGGFGTAPKFSMPVNLRFLLRLGASGGFNDRTTTHTRFGFHAPVPEILGSKACTAAASMALHTLLSMSRSALRDHLGHGFHRYSVTADWNLPHFEKMLYDNAELLAVYCDAWALSHNPEILGTIYDLVEYLTSPESGIYRPEGGWYSSEDADSCPSKTQTEEKKEGAFYVWTLRELHAILGETDSLIVGKHFGVKPDGNVLAQHDVHDEFLNQNTLFVDATPSVLAREFGMKEEEIVRVIKSARKKLSEYRDQNRPAPATDTKVITSWNALAVNALARAAATLSTIDSTRATRCRDGAIRGLNFIKDELFNSTTSKLTRIHDPSAPSDAPSRDLAFLDDYAHTIKAAIGVYDLTLDDQWLSFAIALQSTLDAHFLAPGGGYFQAATPSSDQIIPLTPGTDNTTPSPNGIVCSNLFYLASYASSSPHLDPSLASKYTAHAKSILNAFAPEMLQHPFLYPTLLGAVVMDVLGVKGVVVPRNMAVEDVQSRGVRGFGRTVVRGAGEQGGMVMICDPKDRVCRELKEGELDGSAA